MGHFSMEKPPNPGSVLGGNQQKGLARSLAEQCEHYDSAITSNRERVERNGRLFNQSVNVALFAVGSGGLIFLWWLRAPLGL